MSLKNFFLSLLHHLEFTVILNMNVERGHPCILPDLLRKAFSLLQVSILL